ncbi:nephrocystin-3-like [Gigantopelta aegis]|uniref:nephrocystin-3-like n=1 Tax=Gigantopelta aegis TaxID=1735272 RepID=UPI001B887536|nr:nephrocystin-3-like [Gigantopelta aegis]
MAWCYNGLGLIARYLGKLQEAKELLQKSHDIHKEHDNKRNMADALQNLGLVALDLKEYDKAIAIYEDARKIYEEKFFGTVPHIIGNLLTNVGLCYRRKNDLVSAEKNYLESLRVKANAVGWDHPIIAVNYMNLGTLEMVRKNWKAAEDYAKKCIEIYKINLYPEDNYNHRRALENLLFAWMMMDRYDDEVQDMFWRLCEYSHLSKMLATICNQN